MAFAFWLPMKYRVSSQLDISLAIAGFGVFWTVTAASAGAPSFFPVFGVLFIFFGVAMSLYPLKVPAATSIDPATDQLTPSTKRGAATESRIPLDGSPGHIYD